MPKKRNHYSNQFKFQVALEAARGTKTINQLATEHSVHPNVISQWKRQLLNEGSEIFNNSTSGLHRLGQHLYREAMAKCEV
jgi:transposase-like protein